MLKPTFLFNKYFYQYFGIIFKAKLENRTKKLKTHSEYVYYELHHILPKCLYPEYEDLKIHNYNSVLLTAKEHFICHWLLTRIFSEFWAQKKMERAFSRFSFYDKNRSLSSRYYEIARKYNSLAKIGTKHSEKTKKKMSETASNRSEEYRNKMSNTFTGSKYMNKNGEYKQVKKDEIQNYLDDGWVFGSRPLTEEQHKNRSEISSRTNKGKPKSEEHRKKLSEA